MEIAVNKTEWDNLDEDTRGKIQQIIGANFKDVEIAGVADRESSATLLQNRSLSFDLGKPFCNAACGVAEAAAVAACSAISGGIGVAVCVAAAHAAGDLCRSRC